MNERKVTPANNLRWPKMLTIRKRPAVVALLVLGSSILAFAGARDNLLVECSLMGETQAVRWLLKAGANPNASRRGRTAISLAVEHGHGGVAEALLNCGAKTDIGQSMIEAASESHPSIIEVMLARGAPVDFRGYDGTTALICAVTNGDERSIRILLKHGANRFIRDSTNRSAVDYAELLQETSILELVHRTDYGMKPPRN